MVRPSRTKKVLVAMSGGVDSSVTAALLQKQGYEVVGCFMRLGSNASGDLDEGHDNHDAARCSNPAAPQHRGSQLRHQGCCSLNDAADARLVAAQLDIPLYVLNFTKDFDKVIDYFVKEYNAGRTPNPCIRCNDWLKFGKLASYADSIDADFIATGHYARVDPSAGTGRPARLLCGIDARKDQSYFLFSIPRQRLEQMILPIGEMTKPQVRRLAESLRLPVFDKPDSQEICFVPDNDYAKLIERRTPDRVSSGPILDQSGQVVGQHDGQQRFTIGQRRGVAISLGYPVYVIDKNPQTNTITVGAKRHLQATGLMADQCSWLIDPPSSEPIPCLVKIRHNSPMIRATAQALSENKLQVQFNDPQQAVTPGQAVVCYRDEQVLGGGWITRAV